MSRCGAQRTSTPAARARRPRGVPAEPCVARAGCRAERSVLAALELALQCIRCRARPNRALRGSAAARARPGLLAACASCCAPPCFGVARPPASRRDGRASRSLCSTGRGGRRCRTGSRRLDAPPARHAHVRLARACLLVLRDSAQVELLSESVPPFYRSHNVAAARVGATQRPPEPRARARAILFASSASSGTSA